MFNTVILVIGSAMLSLGICSPMLGWRVNQEAPGTILAGLVLIVCGLWLDKTEDRRRKM